MSPATTRGRSQALLPGDHPVAHSLNTASNATPSDYIVWDPALPCFGRRVRSGGRQTWIVQWRINGRTLRRTLGSLRDVCPEDARAAARDLLAHRATDNSSVRPLSAPLFAGFADQFLRDCAVRWRPATLRAHRTGLRTKLIPAFGDRRIDSIARSDVIAWFEGPNGGCNRSLSVLSSLMLHAETLGLRPEGSNPCAGLRRKRYGFSARYPTGRDYRKIGQAVIKQSGTFPREAALIRFLALTGARRGEALALRWRDINGTCAVLPDSKTGPKTLWLAAPVRTMLQELQQSGGGPYVFGTNGQPANRHRIDYVWRTARRLAGTSGIRLHDLRHGFASAGVSSGEDLRTIAGLLGHADFATTLGYAHLADAPVAAAAQRVSATLARALESNPPPRRIADE